MPDDLLGLAPDNTFTPQYDAGSMHETAERIRASIDPNNPRSLYYGKAAEAKAALDAAEARIGVAYARAGIPQPKPPTPEEIAQQQHAAAFSLTPNPNLTEMLDSRLEGLEERHTPDQLRAMAGALRQELGPAAYDELVAMAKHGVEGEIPAAVLADHMLLKNLGAWGKYNRAYETTKPRK
jgi:hypothetical protein